MTLKEKYTIKNKRRTGQFIFIYSILVMSFIMYFSLARYEKISEGQIKIAVANWKIKLNGKELTGDENILKDSITFIPTDNVNQADPTEIRPGQSGYFDIEIDPTDTEVSFSYQVTLELPAEGLTVSSYSFVGEEEVYPLPDDRTVSGTVPLDGKDIFTEQDKRTIRYYWNWDGADDGSTVRTITAHVQVTQVVNE